MPIFRSPPDLGHAVLTWVVPGVAEEAFVEAAQGSANRMVEPAAGSEPIPVAFGESSAELHAARLVLENLSRELEPTLSNGGLDPVLQQCLGGTSCTTLASAGER